MPDSHSQTDRRVTAPETPAELRARLDALAAAATERPLGRTHNQLQTNRAYFANALVNAWPDISQMLWELSHYEAAKGGHEFLCIDPNHDEKVDLQARLTAAEADAILDAGGELP